MPSCAQSNQECISWCATQANEDSTIIESFMPDEYIEEVIAMDRECIDEDEEVVELWTVGDIKKVLGSKFSS